MIDSVSRYLIDFSLFFLFSWIILLVLACVEAFRHDWS